MWGQGVLTLVGEKEEFVVDAEPNRKPVQLFKGGGDVLPGLCVGENPGSPVLDILESLEVLCWDPKKYSIAIVQPGSNISMNEFLSHRVS